MSPLTEEASSIWAAGYDPQWSDAKQEGRVKPCRYAPCCAKYIKEKKNTLTHDSPKIGEILVFPKKRRPTLDPLRASWFIHSLTRLPVNLYQISATKSSLKRSHGFRFSQYPNSR